jgi:hypothetical protein
MLLYMSNFADLQVNVCDRPGTVRWKYSFLSLKLRQVPDLL